MMSGIKLHRFLLVLMHLWCAACRRRPCRAPRVVAGTGMGMGSKRILATTAAVLRVQPGLHLPALLALAAAHAVALVFAAVSRKPHAYAAPAHRCMHVRASFLSPYGQRDVTRVASNTSQVQGKGGAHSHV